MNDERVDEIFGRVEILEIDLDDDPIERGPKYLNNMVARCRNFTNEIQKYMREVQMELRVVERSLLRQKAEYDLNYNDMMANDPDVAALQGLSKADREALVKTKLEEDIQQIHETEVELTNLKHVETVLDSKLRELRDVNRDIRLQKQLIQSEIETGAMWGTDHGDHDAPHFGPEDINTDLINEDDLFDSEPSPEPDYEDLFSGLEGKSDEESLDVSDSSGKVPERDRPDVNERTGILEPSHRGGNTEEEYDLDFESALERLQ